MSEQKPETPSTPATPETKPSTPVAGATQQTPPVQPAVTPTLPVQNPPEETEQDEDLENLQPLPVEDELTVLKRRADQMGLGYHPNIGLATLQKRINDHLQAPQETSQYDIEAGVTNVNDIQAESGPSVSIKEIQAGYANPDVRIELTPAQKRNEAIADARRLVRVRITCMDPNKRGWPGEIISVSNSVVGTYKKFIPFNTGEPYHIPNIIFQELKDKKCQIFVNGRSADGRSTVKRAQQINAFAIEVLPPLTPAEIKELAQRQAMASGSQE